MEKNQTEEVKVIEGNKLIAEFMGKQYDTPMGRSVNLYRKQVAPHIATKPEYLEYHSNWQWLMAVLDEIEARRFDITIIGYLKIENGESEFVKLCFIQSGQKFVAETEGDSKIEVVYAAVVQFILWYNTQTSQTK